MKLVPRLVFALLLLLFPAQLLPQSPKTKTGATKKMDSPAPATELGRYQIIFSPHVRADTFLVDTLSGKVWRLIQYTDIAGEPFVWKYMDRLDDVLQRLEWEANQPSKPNEPGKKSEFKFN